MLLLSTASRASSAYEPQSFARTLLQFTKRHAALLIIGLAILIRLPYLFVPDTNGFQETSWRQTDTASIAHNFVDNGYKLFYPEINWGGSGPGYVESEFQLYPFITALLYGVFGQHVWLGMLVSLVFTVGTMILFYAFARQLLPPAAAIVALVVFVLSPLYIRYSVTFMPEATVFFFYVGALYWFYRWLNEQRFMLFLLAIVCTAMAILVKPTSIHIGIVFLLMLLQKYRLRVFLKWEVWVFAIASLLPGIVWYLHARNLYLTYGNTFGILSGGDSKFDNLRYWFNPSFYLSLLRIDAIWILAVGGVIPFIIGLILTWSKRQPMLLLFGMAAIVIYYLLIPRYTGFAEYYHLYAVPYTALAVAIGLVWLFRNIRMANVLRDGLGSPRTILGLATVFLIFASISIFYVNDIKAHPQPAWECAQNVALLTPENALIIASTTSTSTVQGTPNNYEEPDMFFYSHRYGWSLPADWHNPQTVQKYQAEGAKYLVIQDKSLYESNPDFAHYLTTNAQQIGPGIDVGCAIYEFNSPQ